MQQGVQNPNQRTVIIFAGIGLVGLVLMAFGFVNGIDDWGLYAIVFGGMGFLLGAICVPILHVTGKSQAKTIDALLKGENLLAHWTFDQDEWRKYTENEHTRGIRLARSTFIWTFAITLVLAVVIEWFADALNGTGAAIAVAIAAVLAALLGGLLYLSAKATHSRNLAGVGEVHIGPNCVYFAGRFYTWAGKMATLRKAAFEPGDPCIVEFNWEYGSGDNRSVQEVRIPVPRGREEEAQRLVAMYHGAA